MIQRNVLEYEDVAGSKRALPSMFLTKEQKILLSDMLSEQLRFFYLTGRLT